MSEPRILIFGSPGHAGLQIIAQVLARRAKVPVVFLVQEGFTAHAQLALTGDPSSCSLLLEGSEVLKFPDIRSVCMDGFYVPAGFNLDGMEQADVEYIQTEIWATLIAMFHQMSQHALVVNQVLERDVFTSRWGTLRYLASQGLSVPRTLVTSDPDSLAAFRAQVGEVVCKSVGDATSEFVPLNEASEARLPNLHLAPVQFEEAPEGPVCHCALIGPDYFCLPADAEPPPKLIAACQKATRGLGLFAAEFSLRQSREERWLVTGMRQFPSQASLLNEGVQEAMAELLEGGLTA